MKQKYLEEEDFALLKVSQKEQFPKKKRHISLKSILKEIGFSKNHLYYVPNKNQNNLLDIFLVVLQVQL